MANERLIFLACNIYSILAEYSLRSCIFRWALWPMGLWLRNYDEFHEKTQTPPFCDGLAVCNMIIKPYRHSIMWSMSKTLTVKVHASLYICTVPTEPFLFAYSCRPWDSWKELLDFFGDDGFSSIYEPHHGKTCLRGLRPGKTQTGLRSHRS